MSSLFPEWLAEQMAKPENNPAQPERIRLMWRQYGKTDGRTCGHCVHFQRYHQGTRWAKCDLSKITGGAGTDWRACWRACGRFVDAEE